MTPRFLLPAETLSLSTAVIQSMDGSQYLVPAMPARPGWQDFVFRPEIRVVNLRHGYTNARRRRLQTIFSSQPVNPSRSKPSRFGFRFIHGLNINPPRGSSCTRQNIPTMPLPTTSIHQATGLTWGLGETRIPNWRHVQPSSWGGEGEGGYILNHQARGVHSPLPGAIQHPAWFQPHHLLRRSPR